MLLAEPAALNFICLGPVGILGCHVPPGDGWTGARDGTGAAAGDGRAGAAIGAAPPLKYKQSQNCSQSSPPNQG